MWFFIRNGIPPIIILQTACSTYGFVEFRAAIVEVTHTLGFTIDDFTALKVLAVYMRMIASTCRYKNVSYYKSILVAFFPQAF